MKSASKRIFKQLVVFLLILSFGVMSFSSTAEAATNKALCISYSFNGQNFEKNGDACGYNNGYTVCTFGTSKKTALSKLKLNVDVYVPKKALKKTGAIIDISPYIDTMNADDSFNGSLNGRISISVVKEKSKIKLYAWDNMSEKNVKASKYVSCKEGSGKYKSYYIIKLKNIPLCDTIFLEDGKTTQKVSSSTKYAFNTGLNICGENNKGSGKLYVDNIKVTSGSKKVVNITFSSKLKFWEVFNKDKKLSKKKASIKTF